MTREERDYVKAQIDRYHRDRLGLTGRGRIKAKGRDQCHAINKYGHRCRWYAKPGLNLCGNHINAVERGNMPTLIAA